MTWENLTEFTFHYITYQEYFDIEKKDVLQYNSHMSNAINIFKNHQIMDIVCIRYLLYKHLKYDGYQMHVQTCFRACDKNRNEGGQNIKYISGFIQLLKRKTKWKTLL